MPSGRPDVNTARTVFFISGCKNLSAELLLAPPWCALETLFPQFELSFPRLEFLMEHLPCTDELSCRVMFVLRSVRRANDVQADITWLLSNPLLGSASVPTEAVTPGKPSSTDFADKPGSGSCTPGSGAVRETNKVNVFGWRHVEISNCGDTCCRCIEIVVPARQPSSLTSKSP